MLYAAIAIVAAGSAFIGLSSNSLWADELYSLSVADATDWHTAWRLSMGDTNPPLYYLLLHAWYALVGPAEGMLRLSSAVLAIATLALFARAARRLFDADAVAFACAIAACSAFWFEQSQNLRSYPLAMLCAALLLDAVLRLKQDAVARRWPVYLQLAAAGSVGALSHAYLLLTAGMVLLFALLDTDNRRYRPALVLVGLGILAIYLGALALQWHIAHHGARHTWFRRDPAFIASHLRRAIMRLGNRQAWMVVLALAAVMLWRRRRPAPAAHTLPPRLDTMQRWGVRLAVFVFAGVAVCGIAITVLVVPSFSDRNLMVCAPFAWLLPAALYQIAGPREGTRGARVAVPLIVLALASQLFVLLPGRMLPSNEPWRASAAYVSLYPGCLGAPLPVLISPHGYGDASPVARRMAEHDYYGYYLPRSAQPVAYLHDELVAALPGLVKRAHSDGCPVLAWSVHDIAKPSEARQLAQQLAAQPAMLGHRLVLQAIQAYHLHYFHWEAAPGAYVWLLDTSPQLPAGAPYWTGPRWSFGPKQGESSAPAAPAAP